jgi:hypothetical protein
VSAASLEDVARLLDASGAAWALIGGHAVNAWLEPRLTADIDVTLEADPEGLAAVRSQLEGGGLRLVRELGATQPSGPDFLRFVSGDGALVLELQIAKTDLQRDLLRRCIQRAGVRVATAEDLLVLKLIAFRTKDRPDLAGLVQLAGLDWAYVERHARAWGVGERLERLRETLA